ncbi:MAG: hypothetical protein WC627_07590 [Legionella sp.]
MNPVIQRFQDHYGLSDEAKALGSNYTGPWKFTADVQRLKPDFYSKVVPHHLIWSLEYTLIRQQLNSLLTKKDEKEESVEAKIAKEKKVKELLIAALMLSELLEHMYLNYLNVPREVEHLRKHQEVYRALLLKRGVLFPGRTVKVVDAGKAVTTKISDGTANLNQLRLLFIRSVRLLTMIEVVGSHTGPYTNFVMILNVAIAPIMPYIAAFFFFPRLLTNLGILLKHTISNPWMSPEERALLWTDRFWMQLKRRWFFIGNDLPWAMVGLINCFVLVGPLAPFAIYLNLAFFAYDVVLAISRAHIEIKQMKELYNEYEKMLADHPEQSQAIKAHQHEIQRLVDFETKRLRFNVATMIGVALAACCALAVFSFCPAIPLTGAIILVALVLITYAAKKIAAEYRPKTDLTAEMDAPEGQIPEQKGKRTSSSSCGFFSSSKSKSTESKPELPRTASIANFNMYSSSGGG